MDGQTEADFEHRLIQLIRADTLRMKALEAVRSLQLPDCWIGAGFIRDFVWDHLHGRSSNRRSADIDVLWFEASIIDQAQDRKLEAQLLVAMPGQNWSVKNQARMHRRNDDQPYSCSTDAMRHWPETATAVAMRLNAFDELQCAAPFGLSDLFKLQLRPTPHFQSNKPHLFHKRVEEKGWLDRFSLVKLRVRI